MKLPRFVLKRLSLAVVIGLAVGWLGNSFRSPQAIGVAQDLPLAQIVDTSAKAKPNAVTPDRMVAQSWAQLLEVATEGTPAELAQLLGLLDHYPNAEMRTAIRRLRQWLLVRLQRCQA